MAVLPNTIEKRGSHGLETQPGEWLAAVAHDALQPVNAILLTTEVLLHSPLDARQQDAIRRMRGSIDHLVRLIGDLTDATAIEGGRCALRLREIDLGSLVAQVTEQELWRRVRFHAPDRRLIVRGDPDRLQQVLENLMSNALKYGEAATPIDVTVEPSGANARVSVSNRGRGIPPTEIDAVFERYMRTREACSSKVNGSGLGLHIARGLVEAHGGRIWVESVVDDVTTFHFTIPLVRV